MERLSLASEQAPVYKRQPPATPYTPRSLQEHSQGISEVGTAVRIECPENETNCYSITKKIVILPFPHIQCEISKTPRNIQKLRKRESSV